MGQRCRVWYEADDDWYEAVIRGYDRHTRLHNLWYPYDEEVRCWSTPSLRLMLSVICSASLCSEGVGLDSADAAQQGHFWAFEMRSQQGAPELRPDEDL